MKSEEPHHLHNIIAIKEIITLYTLCFLHACKWPILGITKFCDYYVILFMSIKSFLIFLVSILIYLISLANFIPHHVPHTLVTEDMRWWWWWQQHGRHGVWCVVEKCKQFLRNLILTSCSHPAAKMGWSRWSSPLLLQPLAVSGAKETMYANAISFPNRIYKYIWYTK